MVDFFLLLMLAGAGDELQGIKQGIMEMADTIAITKTDGTNKERSSIAKAEYQSAMHLMPLKSSGWNPPVITCSALDNQGIKEIWELIEKHRKVLQDNDYFETKRQQQNLDWLKDSISYYLQHKFNQHPSVQNSMKDIEEKVKSGQLAANAAARSLLEKFSNR